MDWLATLHQWTTGAVELRACPNERGAGRISHIYTRDAEDVAAFLKRWDVPGYAVYSGVATRKHGLSTYGAVPDTLELPALWADLDHKPELSVLLGCYYPPSYVIDSGRGLHAYWLLDEPEDVEAVETNDHALVGLLKRLRTVFNGDPAVCDLVRIMRLPGSHNTKYGDPLPVTVVHASDRRYALADLADWLSWQRELIGEPKDPFLAAADALGIRPAVDIEAALAGMSYPGNIHDVQLRVSASLIAAGRPEDEVVEQLLSATRLARGSEGRAWNWQREEAGIRQMCRGAARKFTVVQGGRKQANGPDVPEPEGKQPLVGKVAAVALAVWGRPVITVDGELWTYDGGVWTVLEEHDLRTHIHGAARELGNVGNATLNGAWRWILEDPAHIRRGVRWDQAGVIIGANGALEVATGALVPHSPEHYATRRVGCAIEPGAACPTWLKFLEQKLQRGCAATFQEWAGSMFTRGKRRELTKGLFVVGPTRSGKTQVSEVIRALLGGNTCGLHVRAMSERFGMQPLLRASGWIADDAVGEGVVMDAEAYKVIVTGESVSVERKNKTNVETRFDMPVLLTMNAFPIIKDRSDAVYNRTLALPLTDSESEQTATEIARTVVADELAGVLNWALEGWRRLSARGWYEPPDGMKAAVAEFKGENNAFAEFADLCLQAAPDSMIMRHDLNLVFNGWLESERGGHKWSGKAIAQGLKGTTDGVVGYKVNKGRAWIGVRFAEAAEPFIPQDFGSAKRAVADLNQGLTADAREFVGRPLRTKF